MIQPISLIQPLPQPTFQGRYKMNGSNPDLKALWDRGKLPTVKYGFYGDKLDFNTVTREHLLPKSKGGTNQIENLQVLTVFENLAKRDMNWEEWVAFKKETHTTSDYFIENIL